MKRSIPEASLVRLRQDFEDILTEPKKFELTSVLSEEEPNPQVPGYPRLTFSFNRVHYGRLRQLIDRINLF
jgi:hypothetical protein